MFHCEPGSDEVVEAKLTHERLIELGVFKLLAEGNENSSQTLRILVGNRQVAISFKTTDVALQQEAGREGEVAQLVTWLDGGHEGDAPDVCIKTLADFVDGFES